jgi:peptide/nickel transport system permease protein
MRSPLSGLIPASAEHSLCCRVSIGVIVAIVLATILAPLLAPHDPLHAFEGASLQPPSARYPLGTDTLGRDVLSRVLWGGRQTLSIALQATLITLVPGIIVGVIAGYYGRWVDRLLMACMDMLLAFPSLLLALALISLLGTGRQQVALAVGVAGLPSYARITRTSVLTIRSSLYIDAAQAIGVRARRILTVHILPNVMDSLLSFAAVVLSWALLNGAALAFLGFSGNPATPDWGIMLYEGRTAFRSAPWIALPPGLAITLTVFTINRMADAWQEHTAHW